MKIHIPEILGGRGGSAQGLQYQLVPEIQRLGKAIAGTVQSAQQQYAYNNLAEYEDGPDGLKRAEANYHDTYWQKQNGSDPDAVARYETGINKMQQDYVAKVRKESGDMVADIMSKRAELRARKYIEEADRTQAKLFFNRTVEANKLRANQSARDLAPVFWNPGIIDFAFSALDQEMETQRGILGDYADTLNDEKKGIIVENGLKYALSDPGMAPAVLKKLREDPEYKARLYSFVPAGKVNDIEHAMKSAEAYIRAREADEERAIRKAEMDAKEELRQQREATGAVFVEKYVAGTLTAREILRSNLEATGENSKKYWIEQIKAQNEKYKKAGDEGFKTDPAVKRDVYVKIINDPESISEADIAGMIGAGLSNADGKQLIDERRRRLEKDPARAAAEKAVIQNLGRDRKAGIFGDAQEGDLEYTRQVEAFKRWSRANPDQDPSEYYETVMKPVREARLFGLIDAVRDPKAKREALEASGAVPKGKAKDEYGNRADGTKKGSGYFGELRRPDGKISTEISIGVNMGGKEVEIPLLVPTLTQKEIDHLLADKEPTQQMIDKAVAHARKRMDKGKSPFAQAIDTWLTAARKANPGFSDDELEAYYNKKYGGK